MSRLQPVKFKALLWQFLADCVNFFHQARPSVCEGIEREFAVIASHTTWTESTERQRVNCCVDVNFNLLVLLVQRNMIHTSKMHDCVITTNTTRSCIRNDGLTVLLIVRENVKCQRFIPIECKLRLIMFTYIKYLRHFKLTVSWWTLWHRRHCQHSWWAKLARKFLLSWLDPTALR